MITIRDVSKYDSPPYNSTPIDYGSYDAGIVRVYDGTDPDPMFTTHRDGFIKAGKPWWPYIFYDWFYWAAPQVDAALKILGSNRGYTSIMFDVEKWLGYQYPPRLNLLAGMHDLYAEYKLQTGGILPKYYMNVDLINYLAPVPAWLTDCMLHVADWRGLPAPGTGDWKAATFWQYQGEPDLSRFMGTDLEFHALVNMAPPVPTISDHDLLWQIEKWAETKGFKIGG